MSWRGTRLSAEHGADGFATRKRKLTYVRRCQDDVATRRAQSERGGGSFAFQLDGRWTVRSHRQNTGPAEPHQWHASRSSNPSMNGMVKCNSAHGPARGAIVRSRSVTLVA